MNDLISVILPIADNYDEIEANVWNSIKKIRTLMEQYNLEVIIIHNGDRWPCTPLFQSLPRIFHNKPVIIKSMEVDSSLAELFNYGASIATGKWLYFFNCNYEIIQSNFSIVIDALDKTSSDCYFGKPESRSFDNVPSDILIKNISHVFSCAELFPLSECIIRRKSFLEIGGFQADPFLQDLFPREFWLRASRNHFQFQIIGKEFSHKLSVKKTTYGNRQLISNFIASCYLMRIFQSDIYDIERIRENFIIDLSNHEQRQVGNYEIKSKLPIKIAIVSGVWEYVHNHLSFYNFFNELEGMGIQIYASFLDLVIDPEFDLVDADFVIISRGRHHNIINTINYCNKNNIPTLYMIDDNWFWVGKDWPAYQHIFAPESEAMQIFIECLQNSDAVLVYNEYMEQDVKQNAKSVFSLPCNIRKADFDKELKNPHLQEIVQQILDWKQETQGCIIGYAGSARFTNVAFEALAEVLSEYPQNTLGLLFGTILPDQESLFPSNHIKLPYIQYEEYATIMGKIKPDILLAPLDHSRSSMSKYPNKFLEYAMVGSVGIFSKMPPYQDIVDSGIDGLLVEDEEKDAWKSAILKISHAPDQRNRMNEMARLKVENNYETRVVLPKFIQIIDQVLLARGKR